MSGIRIFAKKKDVDTFNFLKTEADARYLLRRIFSKDTFNLGNMLYAERMKDLEERRG